MSNYNTQLQSNNTDLQTVLQTLQTKAAGATPVISVNTLGLITATAGTKSSTYQLAFQPAKTITPSTTSQIAVSSGYYTGGNITVAGDANLIASNIKNGVSIFGVSGTLVEGSGSGNEYANFIVNNMTTIGSSAFYNCDGLTSVNFPVCTTIGSSAFYNCDGLTSVNFPVCKSIGGSAFYNCGSLKSVNFPVCTTIGSNAFALCTHLTSVNFPDCKSISGSAFAYCPCLTSVNFPVCTTIGSSAFNACTHLTSVNFPVCKSISNDAFAFCYNLTSVNFPVCKSISNDAFTCCYNLSQLYLTGSSLCTLQNSNAFVSTPYAGYSESFRGTPYIYVPQSLLTSYQTATNWTYFSKYFSAVASDGGDDNNNIITFTLYDNIYQAEEGMTFEEWVNSEYNIDGWKIFKGILQSPDGDPLMISVDDAIENGQEY